MILYAIVSFKLQTYRLKSPEINGFYPADIVCYWHLKTSIGTIHLHFDKFDLQASSGGENGCKDFLEIRDVKLYWKILFSYLLRCILYFSHMLSVHLQTNIWEDQSATMMIMRLLNIINIVEIQHHPTILLSSQH